MMKKMKRLAVMTACAALAGTVTAGAACLPQNVQLKPGLNSITIGSQGSLPFDSIRQALDKLCNTLNNRPQYCPGDGIETPDLPDDEIITPPVIKPEIPDETPDNNETPDDNETPDNGGNQTPDNNETPDNGGNQTPDDNETPDNGGNQTPDNGASSQYASEVVRLVNVERQKAGLSALTIHTGAQTAAQTRAGELQRSFSHTRPNGGSAFSALTEAGVNYRTAGENIAMGQKTPAEVVNAWMNSSGHRANILGSQFTSIGVGYVTGSNGTAYWTQLFIG